MTDALMDVPTTRALHFKSQSIQQSPGYVPQHLAGPDGPEGGGMQRR
jgi:hypothetical protein